MGGIVSKPKKPKPSPPPPPPKPEAPAVDPKAEAERERLKRLGAAGKRTGLTDALTVQRKSLLGE